MAVRLTCSEPELVGLDPVLSTTVAENCPAGIVTVLGTGSSVGSLDASWTTRSLAVEVFRVTVTLNAPVTPSIALV